MGVRYELLLTKYIELIRLVQLVQPAHPVQAVQAIQAVQAVQAVQTVQAAQPFRLFKPIRPAKNWPRLVFSVLMQTPFFQMTRFEFPATSTTSCLGLSLLPGDGFLGRFQDQLPLHHHLHRLISFSCGLVTIWCLQQVGP